MWWCAGDMARPVRVRRYARASSSSRMSGGGFALKHGANGGACPRSSVPPDSVKTPSGPPAPRSALKAGAVDLVESRTRTGLSGRYGAAEMRSAPCPPGQVTACADDTAPGESAERRCALGGRWTFRRQAGRRRCRPASEEPTSRDAAGAGSPGLARRPVVRDTAGERRAEEEAYRSLRGRARATGYPAAARDLCPSAPRSSYTAPHAPRCPDAPGSRCPDAVPGGGTRTRCPDARGARTHRAWSARGQQSLVEQTTQPWMATVLLASFQLPCRPQPAERR